MVNMHDAIVAVWICWAGTAPVAFFLGFIVARHIYRAGLSEAAPEKEK